MSSISLVSPDIHHQKKCFETNCFIPWLRRWFKKNQSSSLNRYKTIYHYSRTDHLRKL